LARRASTHGLSAVALTDHDTGEGCGRMAAACSANSVEFIPGTELTADHSGTELHILGYFIDTTSPAFLNQLSHFQNVRRSRILEMVTRLNEHGIGLRVETVLKVANCQSPGRPHVARALVQEGYCSDYDQAFERFLKKGRPAWVPKARIDCSAAIDLIHQAGGVAVLAHPGLYRADNLIPKLAVEGLDGLECWHTKHSGPASEAYSRTAEELGLVATGGSDCHGDAKGHPLIGTLRIPYSQVTQLKERRRKVCGGSEN
jgi:hypothetical protein